MCLAVPGKVVKRDDDLKATVDMMGIERPVSLRLVPTAQVGDYILVHAGFGIQIVDEQEAQETLELVNAMTELIEEDRIHPEFHCKIDVPLQNFQPGTAGGTAGALRYRLFGISRFQAGPRAHRTHP